MFMLYREVNAERVVLHLSAQARTRFGMRQETYLFSEHHLPPGGCPAQLQLIAEQENFFSF